MDYMTNYNLFNVIWNRTGNGLQFVSNLPALNVDMY